MNLAHKLVKFIAADKFFRSSALGNGTDEHYLHQPITGMGVSDAEAEVFAVGCRDDGNAVGVTLDGYFFVISLNYELFG